MTRLEFKLGMPSNRSWNGKWSGADRCYVRYHNVSDKTLKRLALIGGEGYFTYRFDDGWMASVSVRVLSFGERKKKSDGFCGYEWMIRSILDRGEIRHRSDVCEESEMVG